MQWDSIHSRAWASFPRIAAQKACYLLATTEPKESKDLACPLHAVMLRRNMGGGCIHLGSFLGCIRAALTCLEDGEGGSSLARD